MIFKKGDFTLKNVLSVVVAVTLLALLIFLSVRVYDVFYTQDNRNAQSFLNSLTARIDNLDDGQNNTFILQGVDGWFVLGYDLQDSIRPEKCFFESCICLCPESSAESCQNSGICKQMDKGMVDVFTEPFEIDVKGNLAGFFKVNTQGIVHRACIPLESKLHEVRVVKEENSLLVSSPRDSSLGDVKYVQQIWQCGILSEETIQT